MKKCAIFFALLIATLLIAVWTEHRQGIVYAEDVALSNQGPELLQEVADPLSK